MRALSPSHGVTGTLLVLTLTNEQADALRHALFQGSGDRQIALEFVPGTTEAATLKVKPGERAAMWTPPLGAVTTSVQALYDVPTPGSDDE